MAHPDRNGLGRLQKTFRAVGEFFQVHERPSNAVSRNMVLYLCNTRGFVPCQAAWGAVDR
jgi:hypothetical protein